MNGVINWCYTEISALVQCVHTHEDGINSDDGQ